MDCEKFDRIVLDVLYDELDELTHAAARRHMDHCIRCRGIGAGLRATREVGVLPVLDVPEGLELRILAAERRATQMLPLSKRLGRGLSLLAGYAMRPQLSMAALLMLMIGSSLFFLRAQPGDREHVLVTERGVPENDNEPSAAVLPEPVSPVDPEPEAQRSGSRPAFRTDESSARRDRVPDAKAERAASAAPARAPVADDRGGGLPGAVAGDKLAERTAASDESDTRYDAAMAAYRGGRYSEAEQRFAEVSNQGGPHAASAALYEVESLRMVSGCPSAGPRFEDVHTRYPGPIGNSAAWQAADCYRALGELARARQNYEELAADPSYRARAEAAIGELNQRAGAEVAARKMPAGRTLGTGKAPTSVPAAATPAAPTP